MFEWIMDGGDVSVGPGVDYKPIGSAIGRVLHGGSVALSGDGKTFALGKYEEAILIYDVTIDGLELKHTLPWSTTSSVWPIAMDRNSCTVVAGAHRSSTGAVFRKKGGGSYNPIVTFEGGMYFGSSVAVAANGDLLFIGGHNPSTGFKCYGWTGSKYALLQDINPGNSIISIDTSDDGNTLLCCPRNESGDVVVYTRNPVTLKWEVLSTIRKMAGGLTKRGAISADGGIIVLGGVAGEVHIYTCDPDSGCKPLQVIDGGGSLGSTVAISGDGNTLGITNASANTVTIYRMEAGKGYAERNILSGGSGFGISVEFDHRGGTLAIDSKDGTGVKLYRS